MTFYAIVGHRSELYFLVLHYS